MTERKKPLRLQAGMTLGVVAPSSPGPERAGVAGSVAALERLGFRVVFGPHVNDRREYLAGRDEDRADDRLAMFFRDDVDAVLCMRGGYGAIRTAHALDRDRLAQLANRPPKPFIGFSDITILHTVFARELGWTTFYGPGLSSFLRASDYTIDAFRHALMETEPFDIPPDPDDPTLVQALVPGVVEGELVGGCLPLLTALMGTPWEPDLRGKVLFFENVRRAPVEVDRMLMQLLLAGKLQECAGIVIGEHFECGPRTVGNTLSLEEVFDDLLQPLGVPTIAYLPIGHGRHIATLPIGARVRLDATNTTLRILEPGVT